MKTNSILASVLAILLAFNMGTPAFAASEECSGACGSGLSFVLSSDGVLTITGTGDMWNYSDTNGPEWRIANVEVRKVIINKGVTSIGSAAFWYCDSMEEISIPDSVTGIGEGAFYRCDKLRAVDIPPNVSRIGNGAFYKCLALTAVSIPDSVTELGAFAFQECSNLSKVKLSGEIEAINERTFDGCSSLEDIVIPDKVRSIGENAFDGSGLKKVTLGKNVKVISDNAFYASDIESLSIPDSVLMIGEAAFDRCKELKTLQLGKNVADIGGHAFCECSKLEAVYFPADLKTIGYAAFTSCDSIKNAYYEGTREQWDSIEKYDGFGRDFSGVSLSFASTPSSLDLKRPTVQPTSQKLTVNGEAKNTEIYNIDGSNFFKLRDMAMLLNGTSSQFSVAFDAASGTISVRTGAAYKSVGGELTTGEDKSATAAASAQRLTINGSAVELTAYNIGGNNFFKLRDLGEALGFHVDWDGATSTMVVTSR